MSHENQMDAAQTLGLIKGLTAVVQEQSNAMKDATDQIKQLAATVENLTKSQPQVTATVHGITFAQFGVTGIHWQRAPGSFFRKDPKFINYFECSRSILADLFKTAVPKRLACIRRTELSTRGTSETVGRMSRKPVLRSTKLFLRACTGSAGHEMLDPEGSAYPRTFRNILYKVLYNETKPCGDGCGICPQIL